MPDNVKKNEDDDKIYIFVSHSHRDILPVRIIRNYLESLGTEPILFFLKSLTDEDGITRLIEMEIDARIWFIYCKSPNALDSKWVKTEIAYAKETGKQFSLTIDLDEDVHGNVLSPGCVAAINDTIFRIKKLKRIFYSHSRASEPICEDIISRLSHYGIRFFNMNDLFTFTGASWFDSIEGRMDDSPFCLCFLQEGEKQSVSLDMEMRMAEYKKKRIVFVRLFDERKSLDPSELVLNGERLLIPFDISDMRKSSNNLMMLLMNILGASKKQD